MALKAEEIAAASHLLDKVLALDAADREDWLLALPAEHARLVPALREILARAETASGLLLDRPPRLSERAQPDPRTVALKAGAHVGPYQLVRELGAGGMAEVWLARRADGAYRREVALKLPKLARLRPDLDRLFARERDILAGLEHRHIARLYDAGVSSDGLPYLAMEYVQGRPVTGWCDANRVGLRERLNLFLQVVDAVDYAHARKVVHRDLKPSNILVTETGEARLLDFGIAKMLAEEDADHAPIRFYTRALTPDYASPELLRGDLVESTSDVYSLGAVLYELLAGNRPYQVELGVSAAQLVRALASASLEPPSARVAPGAGAARATTQERLAGRLRGSLDAIVLKALAWRPEDRYPDVAALAADLQRYLRGEPVRAVPDRLTTDELVTALARNPNVRVRLSPQGASGAARREAGVGADLTAHAAGSTPPGSGGASTTTLRITAQLIGTRDGMPLWSHTFERELGNADMSGGDIARVIADAVRAEAESGALAAKGTERKR
jgi:serine/threonine-protein kinase